MRSALAAAALLLACCYLACCCSAPAGATTQPSLMMHVQVVLTTSRISLSTAVVPRGNEVEFAVRNRTGGRRVFSVAGKAIHVPAKALRLTAISFQARGRYRVVSRSRTSRVTTVFRVR